MGKKKAYAGTPLEISGITIIPITESSLGEWRGKRGAAFSGRSYPVSAVVASPSGKRAIGVDGEEVSLDSLMKEVPGLKEMLDKIQN